jgi:hypothetical protein
MNGEAVLEQVLRLLPSRPEGKTTP